MTKSPPQGPISLYHHLEGSDFNIRILEGHKDSGYSTQFFLPPLPCYWASLVAQLVKNPAIMRETWVRSLGWEDPLEKGKAMNSSIVAWRVPWAVSSMRSQRIGHVWVTFTSIYPFLKSSRPGHCAGQWHVRKAASSLFSEIVTMKAWPKLLVFTFLSLYTYTYRSLIFIGILMTLRIKIKT